MIPDHAFTPLASSSVHAYHYDPTTGDLTVRYKNGDYSYHGVEPHHAEGLQAADSPNAYLSQHIKPAHKVTKL